MRIPYGVADFYSRAPRCRRLLHFLVLGAALAAASCSDPRPPERDIVIGLIGPLERGPEVRDGAVLAADEINAAGGIAIGGRRARVQLIVEDCERGPQAAVSKALKLINRDRVVALVGVPRSYNAIPVARLAERHRLPLVSTMSTHPETTAGKRYVFRLAFLDALQGEILADFVVDDLGAGRVAALVNAASTYSAHLGELFSRRVRDRGGQLVAYESFTEDHLDVGDQLRRIGESGAEVLFMPNHSDMVKVHARAARRLGVDATLLGGDSWSNGIDPGECPEVRGSYFSDFWAPDDVDEKTRAFIAEYRRRFGIAPSASAALAYDSVSIVAAAIRLRGGADPESIRDGLASLEEFRGVTGPIRFRGSGDPSRSVFIRRIGGDGQVRLHREIDPEPAR